MDDDHGSKQADIDEEEEEEVRRMTHMHAWMGRDGGRRRTP
jgi:hypothetical protein